MDNKTIKAALLLSVLGVGACSDEEAGRIVLGRGFETNVLNTLQYQKPVVVQVTETDGTPAAGAVVTISVVSSGYYKGGYIPFDQDGDGTNDVWTSQDSGAGLCANEDTNNNGVLDAPEDFNGNGILDPANAATISAHPTETPTVNPGSGTITTDSTGFGYFSVIYPKSQGNWVQVTLTAKVGDGSPGNTQTDIFDLPVILADLDDLNISPPGGTTSAYGSAANCNDPS